MIEVIETILNIMAFFFWFVVTVVGILVAVCTALLLCGGVLFFVLYAVHKVILTATGFDSVQYLSERMD